MILSFILLFFNYPFWGGECGAEGHRDIIISGVSFAKRFVLPVVLSSVFVVVCSYVPSSVGVAAQVVVVLKVGLVDEAKQSQVLEVLALEVAQP